MFPQCLLNPRLFILQKLNRLLIYQQHPSTVYYSKNWADCFMHFIALNPTSTVECIIIVYTDEETELRVFTELAKVTQLSNI